MYSKQHHFSLIMLLRGNWIPTALDNQPAPEVAIDARLHVYPESEEAKAYVKAATAAVPRNHLLSYSRPIGKLGTEVMIRLPKEVQGILEQTKDLAGDYAQLLKSHEDLLNTWLLYPSAKKSSVHGIAKHET